MPPRRSAKAAALEDEPTATASAESEPSNAAEQTDREYYAKAGAYVADDSVGFLESAFTPGVHASLVRALNVVFAVIFVLLLIVMIIIGLNIHVCVFFVLSLLLFGSLHWYSSRLLID